MDSFKVESVRIKSTPEKAFRYVADPKNLPRWTHAFKRVHNGKAIMATPAGAVEVGLQGPTELLQITCSDSARAGWRNKDSRSKGSARIWKRVCQTVPSIRMIPFCSRRSGWDARWGCFCAWTVRTALRTFWVRFWKWTGTRRRQF